MSTQNGKYPNNLRKIRKAEGLTIAELVVDSEVSRTTIKNLEEGRRDSKHETKQKLVLSINNLSKKQPEEKYEHGDIFPE